MREAEIIANTPGGPVTLAAIRADLAALGVRPGMVLLTHSSLSALGWVSGGAVAVILALEAAIGSEGTLVMPTHSGELSDPAQWEAPPVPAVWMEAIRDTMPAYDAQLTPTRGMGKIPETFRKQNGVLRSQHPQVSFAAWGKAAQQVTAGHAFHNGLGEQSPLARIYDLDGWVLLLGVGHANSTSLHLAEYRANYLGKHEVINGAPVLVDDQRVWFELRDINVDSYDFEAIGADFARSTGLVRQGRVGYAEVQLMPQRALVDYAVRWMEEYR